MAVKDHQCSKEQLDAVNFVTSFFQKLSDSEQQKAGCSGQWIKTVLRNITGGRRRRRGRGRVSRRGRGCQKTRGGAANVELPLIVAPLSEANRALLASFLEKVRAKNLTLNILPASQSGGGEEEEEDEDDEGDTFEETLPLPPPRRRVSALDVEIAAMRHAASKDERGLISARSKAEVEAAAEAYVKQKNEEFNQKFNALALELESMADLRGKFDISLTPQQTGMIANALVFLQTKDTAKQVIEAAQSAEEPDEVLTMVAETSQEQINEIGDAMEREDAIASLGKMLTAFVSTCGSLFLLMISKERFQEEKKKRLWLEITANLLSLLTCLMKSLLLNRVGLIFLAMFFMILYIRNHPMAVFLANKFAGALQYLSKTTEVDQLPTLLKEYWFGVLQDGETNFDKVVMQPITSALFSLGVTPFFLSVKEGITVFFESLLLPVMSQLQHYADKLEQLGNTIEGLTNAVQDYGDKIQKISLILDKLSVTVEDLKMGQEAITNTVGTQLIQIGTDIQILGGQVEGVSQQLLPMAESMFEVEAYSRNSDTFRDLIQNIYQQDRMCGMQREAMNAITQMAAPYVIKGTFALVKNGLNAYLMRPETLLYELYDSLQLSMIRGMQRIGNVVAGGGRRRVSVRRRHRGRGRKGGQQTRRRRRS